MTRAGEEEKKTNKPESHSAATDQNKVNLVCTVAMSEAFQDLRACLTISALPSSPAPGSPVYLIWRCCICKFEPPALTFKQARQQSEVRARQELGYANGYIGHEL
eukprot:282358-Hanusia_phi.AAC.1